MSNAADTPEKLRSQIPYFEDRAQQGIFTSTDVEDLLHLKALIPEDNDSLGWELFQRATSAYMEALIVPGYPAYLSILVSFAKHGSEVKETALKTESEELLGVDVDRWNYIRHLQDMEERCYIIRTGKWYSTRYTITELGKAAAKLHEGRFHHIVGRDRSERDIALTNS